MNLQEILNSKYMPSFGTLVGILAYVFIISFIIWAGCNTYNGIVARDSKTTYSGVIVGKIYEAPTSGYKSHTDAEYYLLLKEDRQGKVIRIYVLVPMYYQYDIGKRAAFTLSNGQLYGSGNIPDWSKNLYGE